MTESKWHPVIKFVSGTLLLADEVLNIWYYNTYEDSLQLVKLRAAFAAAIAVVPICYFVIAAYFLYPEYQENIIANYQPFDLFLKKGISRPAGKLKNCLKSVRAKFTIIIAVLLGILVGFGFLMWSFGVVIVGIVIVAPSLLGLISDALIWFGSSCYLALFIYVKFFNCTSYHTISECMGSDSRQQLNHRDKILMFVMILNAIQLKLQSFPCLVMKIINEVRNNPVQKIFGTGIIISIINIVAQIVAFYVMRKEVLHIRRLNESEAARAQGMIIDAAVYNI